jgi:hypothetical protein
MVNRSTINSADLTLLTNSLKIYMLFYTRIHFHKNLKKIQKIGKIFATQTKQPLSEKLPKILCSSLKFLLKVAKKKKYINLPSSSGYTIE